MGSRPYYYSSLTASQPSSFSTAGGNTSSSAYALDTPLKSSQDTSFSSSQMLFSSSQANVGSSHNLYGSSAGASGGGCLFPAFQGLKQVPGIGNSQHLSEITSRMDDMNSKIVDAILGFRGDLKDLPDKTLSLLRTFLDFHHRDLAEAAALKAAESFEKGISQTRAVSAEAQAELVKQYLTHVDKSIAEFSLTISNVLENKLAEFRQSLLQDCVDDVFSKMSVKLDSFVKEFNDQQRLAFEQLKNDHTLTMSNALALIELTAKPNSVLVREAEVQVDTEMPLSEINNKDAKNAPKSRRGRKKSKKAAVSEKVEIPLIPELELETEKQPSTKKRTVGGGRNNKRKSTGNFVVKNEAAENTKNSPPAQSLGNLATRPGLRSSMPQLSIVPSQTCFPSFSTDYSDCDIYKQDKFDKEGDDLSYLLD